MQRTTLTTVHEMQLRDIFHAFEMARQSETFLKERIFIQSEELEKEMDQILEEQKKCLSGFRYDGILLQQDIRNQEKLLPSSTAQQATLLKQVTTVHAEKLKQDLLQLLQDKQPTSPIRFYQPSSKIQTNTTTTTTTSTTTTMNKSVKKNTTTTTQKEGNISIQEIEPLEKFLKESPTNKAKDRYHNSEDVL